MVNRSKMIGTAAETAVVRYLRDSGFPGAERTALAGAADRGDITGTPGVAWEVKAGAQTANPTPSLMEQWLAQTEVERANAGAEVGVLVCARAGYSSHRAEQWWAHLKLTRDLRLHLGLGGSPIYARLTLAATALVLRTAGYGQPLVVS